MNLHVDCENYLPPHPAISMRRSSDNRPLFCPREAGAKSNYLNPASLFLASSTSAIHGSVGIIIAQMLDRYEGSMLQIVKASVNHNIACIPFSCPTQPLTNGSGFCPSASRGMLGVFI